MAVNGNRPAMDRDGDLTKTIKLSKIELDVLMSLSA